MGMYQVVWGTSNMWKLGLRSPHSWIQFCWRFTVEGSELEERSTPCRCSTFRFVTKSMAPSSIRYPPFLSRSSVGYRLVLTIFSRLHHQCTVGFHSTPVHFQVLDVVALKLVCCWLSHVLWCSMYICLITFMTLNSRFRTEKVRPHLCCFVFWPLCSWIISVLIAERTSRSEAKVQAQSWGDISGTRPALSWWFVQIYAINQYKPPTS